MQMYTIALVGASGQKRSDVNERQFAPYLLFFFLLNPFDRFYISLPVSSRLVTTPTFPFRLPESLNRKRVIWLSYHLGSGILTLYATRHKRAPPCL